MKFEVYDFDLMSADDAMGSATLPLTHFAKMKAKFKDGKVKEGRRRKGDHPVAFTRRRAFKVTISSVHDGVTFAQSKEHA